MTTSLEKLSLTVTAYGKARQFIKRQNNSVLITKVQDEKLQKLIAYCYENIKYYRELFDEHHIRPADIKTAADLVNVPVLTKSELRKRFWDFLPKELPACRISRTSGSTGIPVCILSDINSRLNNSAAVIRYRKNLGINFFGTPIITLQKNEQQPHEKPHWTFLQGLHKTWYVNPYTNRDADIDYAIKTLSMLKNPAIIAITPAIRALAYRIRDGILPAIKPCAVLTTGEYLSHPVRELLEDTFKVTIADIYACNEAGDIAWQCREGLYHINADNCIVEILKDGQPAGDGETGEVAITNLNRYSMPFVRYKNGDLARFAAIDCPCGCKLPALSEIAGRTGEDIYLPDGQVIPWNQLKGFMNHPDIRQFQLIQNEDASLTVKFVPEQYSDTEHTKNILASRFEGLLAGSIKLEFSIAEAIAPAPSGKSKLVICHYRPSNRISSSL